MLGAMAPSPESDCMGAIRVEPPYRQSVWSVGHTTVIGWEPLFLFNTKRDAVACLGTSRHFEVRQLMDGRWQPK